MKQFLTRMWECKGTLAWCVVFFTLAAVNNNLMLLLLAFMGVMRLTR